MKEAFPPCMFWSVAWLTIYINSYFDIWTWNDVDDTTCRQDMMGTVSVCAKTDRVCVVAFLKRTWRVTRPFSQTLTLETNEWELFWLVAIEWMKINFNLTSINSTEFLGSLWMFLGTFIQTILINTSWGHTCLFVHMLILFEITLLLCIVGQ